MKIWSKLKWIVINQIMCDKIKTISKTNDGELQRCSSCNSYILTYKNLFFEFAPNEFRNFKKYISKVEVNYCEVNDYTTTKKKVFIPTEQENLILMFSRIEIENLRKLLNINNKNQILNSKDIDLELVYN